MGGQICSSKSSKDYLNPQNRRQLYLQFNKPELELLIKLYKDIALRDANKIIKKEQFLKVFQFTGLWGMKMFQDFDQDHKNYLDFNNFMQGLASCIKITEQQKIRHLFELYDLGKDGFIDRNDFTTMLYNYPKTSLKKLLNDKDFLVKAQIFKKLNDQRLVLEQEEEQVQEENNKNDNVVISSISQQNQQLNNNTKLNKIRSLLVTERSEEQADNLIKQTQPRKSNQDSIKRRQNTEIVSNNQQQQINDNQSIKMINRQSYESIPNELNEKDNNNQTSYNAGAIIFKKNNQKEENQSIKSDIRQQNKKESNYILANSGIKNRENANQRSTLIKQQMQGSANRISLNQQSISQDQGNNSTFSINSQITFNINNKQYPMKRANISKLVNKFVNYIYKNYENEGDKLNESQFTKIVKEHPILLTLFQNTFHEDVWGYQDNNYNYQQKNIEYKGYLYKRKKNNKIVKYWFELREFFLFQFQAKNKKPKNIICLEGLQTIKLDKQELIEKTKDQFQFGFTINHRDKIYREKTYYCESYQEYSEWLRILKNYDRSCPFQLYELREKIGQGGFSVVYRAQDRNDKEEYALKVIQKFRMTEMQKQVLENETEVMKFLNHPGVIKFKETIETKTHIYIITELVKGGDLLKYINGKEFLEEVEASKAMKQLIETVIYIHSSDIIHRDLKPENIMVVLDPQEEQIKHIKIIDFGFSKFLHKENLNEENYGTPNYIAGEILLGQQPSFQSDVFSLGVIMFAMLRGKLPFDSYIPDEIFRNTIQGNYDINDTYWQNISPEAIDLVKRMLENDPLKRIELKHALQHPWIRNRDNLKQYLGRNKKKHSKIYASQNQEDQSQEFLINFKSSEISQ